MKKVMTFFFVLGFFAYLFAQEPVDLEMITKIKNEGLKNSQVMATLSFLTDVYGPRLTGSPELREAAEWAVERLKEWGIPQAQLEEWGTFGRGWRMERVLAIMTTPRYIPLIAYPKAWTGSTNGTVSGSPILIEIDSAAQLAAYKDKLAGSIILLGDPRDWEPKFEADARRHDAERLAELAEAPDPGARSPWAERRQQWRAMRELRRQISEFLAEEKAAVVLEPSEREHGTVRVYGGGSRQVGEDEGIASLVVSNEQYGRIYRMLRNDIAVELKIDVKNSFFENDSLGFNVIAEIPGTDKKLKNEVVMLGGHVDSWHTGTGATDNAASCAVAMEALRILKKIGVKPRRTIRLALWSGEEQGYLGSRGYLARHYGDRTTMELKPAHKNFSVYFNMDNGAGKIRGIYLQENDAARPIFEAWLKPFHDMGAETISIRNTSGTDHIPFNELGLPGFQFIQDPIDYMTRTHHTNMDVYEHVLAGDVMQASVIMASFVYHAAMRDAKFPRKPLPDAQPENRRRR